VGQGNITMSAPQTLAAKPAPLTGSHRVALSRRRKRDDIIFVGIEMLPTERDELIRIGLLNKADRNSKIAVRDALYAYFEKYLDPETTATPS
jgi:hypothetical protein